MAIIDYSLRLAKAQAMGTTAAVTTVSENVIDLGPTAGVKILQERGVLQVRVDTLFVGGTSVTFQLVCDSAANLTTAPEVLMSSGAILTASLVADAIVFEAPLPQKIPKRYLGVKAVGVGTFSAGKFDANIAVGVEVQ
jgi:hypothetical protein